ncbi:CHAD domain-containing protein [Burkholderia stagnalis]|uniref:CHAD domain-containing protein n=1 Tax=Burkholderia stagnalis TaxID=1503054 RepID=UPI0009BD36B8|nr:CHAD domain-containing protein [Burkholderia stagnalis]
MTFADVFMLSAASSAEDAARWATRLDPQANPEVFHKFRVALRRMQSLWWAYVPLLDPVARLFRRRTSNMFSTVRSSALNVN